jgi:hypothetical protein
MSFALHVIVGLVGALGISSRRLSPSTEVVPVGIAFVDAVANGPALLGTPEGATDETLLESIPEEETPTAEEAAKGDSAPPAFTPQEPTLKELTPLPAASSKSDDSAKVTPPTNPESLLEPLPKPIPEPIKSSSGSIKSSSESAPSQPSELLSLPKEQKASPQVEQRKSSTQQEKKSSTKLDALMEEETSSQEDFLQVLKNIDATKKGSSRTIQSSQISGKNKAKPRKGVTKGALEGALTAGEEDFIRQQIYPHWSIPGGIAEAENLIVELRITLQDDGTVTNIQILDQNRCQENPQYRAAAESARRAVRIASPLKIPPNRLELFRSFRLRFNPKDALR